MLDALVLLPHIRSGAIKALAVTSATRSDALLRLRAGALAIKEF